MDEKEFRNRLRLFNAALDKLQETLNLPIEHDGKLRLRYGVTYSKEGNEEIAHLKYDSKMPLDLRAICDAKYDEIMKQDLPKNQP